MEYVTERFPPVREATVDLLDAASRKHMIQGLFEVDVTRARRLLKERWSRGEEPVSLTSYVIMCCSQAVSAHPRVHACRARGRRLVIFNDVDVSTTVERTRGGQMIVVPTVIRAADKKDIDQIAGELREARERPLEDSRVYRLISWYVRIPRVLRRLFFRIMDRSPKAMKARVGTVMVTSVGMFGRGAGWGIPIASHPVNVTVGGLVERPAVESGKLSKREHLCLTVSFDHDIVDGAPAARFIRHLTRLIERGYGLD